MVLGCIFVWIFAVIFIAVLIGISATLGSTANFIETQVTDALLIFSASVLVFIFAYEQRETSGRNQGKQKVPKEPGSASFPKENLEVE